jgi:hypothetical protein
MRTDHYRAGSTLCRGLDYRETRYPNEEKVVKLSHLSLLLSLLGGGIITVVPVALPPLHAATQQKAPEITGEASAALLRMGETLRAEQFSFQAQTIRVYADTNGQLLHIFHTMKVVVHRPNRLLVDVTGDDGSRKLVFDGKNALIYIADQNKYASIPVPEGTISAMMEQVMGRLGVDFPLADFLTDAPNKAFLTGVTSGKVVNIISIDGSPYLHLLFSQPPGIELELWLAKNEQSLPRRLIVTYRNVAGQPSFIALFSDWDFNIHPADADFSFQPPANAAQLQLKPQATAAPAAGGKGSKP